MNSVDLEAGSMTITIKYVKNPNFMDDKSTGNFKIETFKKDILLDSNANFG
jgi:hypothetical protein